MSRAAPNADAWPHRHDAVSPDVVSHAVSHAVDAVPREARQFQGQRAGIVTRTAANAADFVVAAGAVTLGYAVWSAVRFVVNPRQFTFPELPFAVLLACLAMFMFAYFTASWATTGRTYGDHLLGLRVVSFRGERLSWLGAAVRAGFCVLLPLGLYWAVLSPTNRSVQDAVLRTSVLYDWTTTRGRTTGSPAQGEPS